MYQDEYDPRLDDEPDPVGEEDLCECCEKRKAEYVEKGVALCFKCDLYEYNNVTRREFL